MLQHGDAQQFSLPIICAVNAVPKHECFLNNVTFGRYKGMALYVGLTHCFSLLKDVLVSDLAVLFLGNI